MTTRLARSATALFIFCAALVIARPAIAQARPANPPNWGYSGADGPDHWADLEPDYAECKSGHRESPIDIVGAQLADLPRIHFDYKLAPLKVINNGYTIQFNYESGSSITINGTALPLVQFHFHHVSENEIDGKKYDMELHFVHVDAAANRTAVVAVFIKSGAENAPLRDLWSHIPHDKGKEVEYKKVVINAADLVARRPELLHIRWLAHHSSLQGGRQVVRPEDSHRSFSRPDRGICKTVSGQRSADPADEWPRNSRKQFPLMKNRFNSE